jgi:hypothetical protein
MLLVIIPLRDGRSTRIHLLKALRDVLFDPVAHQPVRAAIDRSNLLAEDPQHRVKIADIPRLACLSGAYAFPGPALRLQGGDLGQSGCPSDLLPVLASQRPSGPSPPCAAARLVPLQAWWRPRRRRRPCPQSRPTRGCPWPLPHEDAARRTAASYPGVKISELPQIEQSLR